MTIIRITNNETGKVFTKTVRDGYIQAKNDLGFAFLQVLEGLDKAELSIEVKTDVDTKGKNWHYNSLV